MKSKPTIKSREGRKAVLNNGLKKKRTKRGITLSAIV